MKTECVTDGILDDVVTYHFGFEPRRPRVAGYNQQPKRKDIQDLVQICKHKTTINHYLCFFPLTESLIKGVKRKSTAKFILDLKSA